jgi:hypothetical protein
MSVIVKCVTLECLFGTTTVLDHAFSQYQKKEFMVRFLNGYSD